MQETCTCGSVRGARGNPRPYRDRPSRPLHNRARERSGTKYSGASFLGGLVLQLHHRLPDFMKSKGRPSILRPLLRSSGPSPVRIWRS
jgi:hypothetical protein